MQQYLILVGLFVSLCGAQQCGQEFEGFRKCMKERNEAPEVTGTEFPGGSVSEDITNCFVNAGCKTPKLVSGELAGSEEFMGVLIKCSDAVKDNLKTMVQGCMQRTSNIGPGFILHPDLIAPLPLAMPSPPPPPPAVVIMSATTQVYDDSVCPPGSQDSARKCMNDVAQKFMPFDPATCKSPIETQFTLAEHCYNQDQCKNTMTKVCREDLANLRSYLCQCAKELFPDNNSSVAPLINTFKQCVKEQTGAPGLQSNAVATFVQYAQRLLTNLICMKAPDPCNPEVPAQPLGNAIEQGA